MRGRLQLKGKRLSANDNLNTVIRPMTFMCVANTHRSNHGFVSIRAIQEGNTDE